MAWFPGPPCSWRLPESFVVKTLTSIGILNGFLVGTTLSRWLMGSILLFLAVLSNGLSRIGTTYDSSSLAPLSDCILDVAREKAYSMVTADSSEDDMSVQSELSLGSTVERHRQLQCGNVNLPIVENDWLR